MDSEELIKEIKSLTNNLRDLVLANTSNENDLRSKLQDLHEHVNKISQIIDADTQRHIYHFEIYPSSLKQFPLLLQRCIRYVNQSTSIFGIFHRLRNTDTQETLKVDLEQCYKEISEWIHPSISRSILTACQDCNHPIIIGVCGATRSGKSTLAKRLFNHFGEKRAYYISQDYFFERALMPRHEILGCRNWEIPQAIDWRLFKHSILDTIQQAKIKCDSHSTTSTTKIHTATKQFSDRKIIIIEGFLLFQPDFLDFSLFDVAIFLNISKDVCYQRRMSTKSVSEEYFHQLIWPAYVEHNKHIKDLNVMQLDAETLDADAIFSTTMEYIVKINK